MCNNGVAELRGAPLQVSQVIDGLEGLVWTLEELETRLFAGGLAERNAYATFNDRLALSREHGSSSQEGCRDCRGCHEEPSAWNGPARAHHAIAGLAYLEHLRTKLQVAFVEVLYFSAQEPFHAIHVRTVRVSAAQFDQAGDHDFPVDASSRGASGATRVKTRLATWRAASH